MKFNTINPVLCMGLFVLKAHFSFAQVDNELFFESIAFRHSISDAFKQNDTLALDSLFNQRDGKDFSIQNHIDMFLSLEKYDELEKWLVHAEIPDSTQLFSDYNYVPIWYTTSKREAQRKELLTNWQNAIEQNIDNAELRELLILYIINEKLNYYKGTTEEQASYNVKNRAFVQQYPNSRFCQLLRYQLNREVEVTNRSAYIDLTPGFYFKNIHQSGSSSQLENGIWILRLGFGFGRNYYSFSVNTANMSEFPTHIDTAGPYNQLRYSRFVLRYDRSLFETRRFEGFAFGDFGIGRSVLSNDQMDDIEPSDFVSLTYSAGIKVNWNFCLDEVIVNVDDEFDQYRYYLNVETGLINNHLSFMNQYNVVWYFGIGIGVKAHGLLLKTVNRKKKKG